MGIEFEQDTQYTSTTNRPSVSDEGGFVGWLIKKNIVKTRNGANILLICLSIIFIGIAICLPLVAIPH